MDINKQAQEVSFRERICFGLGDASVNVFMGVTTMFLSIYYTDVFGLSPAFIGVLFLSIRFVDAITDPLVGALTDRFVGKLGRYRTWMKWAAVPYALSLLAVFWGPDLPGPWAKMAYATITYLLLILCNTCFSVPYISLNGVITSNPAERIEINGIRFFLAIGSRLVISLLIPTLMACFADAQQSYRVSMLCISALTLVLALFCIYGTKERVTHIESQNADSITRLSPRQQLSAFWENEQARLICLFLASINICYTLRMAGLAYYVKYYLQQSDYYLSLFLVASSVAGMISPSISLWFVKRKRVTIRTLLIASQVVPGILMLLGGLVNRDGWMVALALTAAVTFVAEFQSAIVWSSPGNCADYGRIKYGKNIRGVLNGALMFFLKAGMAIGGALVGFILAVYGYEAGTPVTAPQIQGFVYIVWTLPGVISLANTWFACKWLLTPEYMQRFMTQSRA